MKDIVILISTFLLLFQISSKGQKAYYHQKNLKGKVKSITAINDYGYGHDTIKETRNDQIESIEFYLFDPEGKELVGTIYNSDTSLRSKEVFEYNRDGKLAVRYWNEGGDSGKSVSIYDKNGKLSNVIANNSNGKRSETNYYYNKKANLIKSTSDYSDEKSETIYIYDEYDHLIEEDSYINGKLSYMYKYDISKNRIEERGYNPDGSSHETFRKYQYNKYNQEVKEETYNKDGSLRFIDSFKYDINGNEIESCGYLPNDSITGKTITKYDYDSLGNWVREIVLLWNNSLVVLRREIEYYSNLPNDKNGKTSSNTDSIIKEINSNQYSIFDRVSFGKKIFLCVNFEEANEFDPMVFVYKEFAQSHYLKGNDTLSKEYVKQHLFDNADSILISGSPSNDEMYYYSLEDYISRLEFYKRDTILKTSKFIGIIYEEINDDGAEKFLYTFDMAGKVIARLSIASYRFSGYSTGMDNERIPRYNSVERCIQNNFNIEYGIQQGGEIKYRIEPDGKIIKNVKVNKD